MGFGDKNFTYGPKIVKDGLILYMDAANPRSYISGNTTCNDLVSSSVGTLENGVGFSIENNGAWSFDGSDDNINCGRVTDIEVQTLSYSMWIKRTDNRNQCVFMKGISSNRGLAVWITSADLLVCQAGNFTNDSYFGSQVSSLATYIPLDTWGYIAFTHEQTATGATQKIYINGILRNTYISTTVPYIISYPGTNLYFGQRNNATYRFAGDISNVKIYNIALTQEEVQQNYNTLKPRFGL